MPKAHIARLSTAERRAALKGRLVLDAENDITFQSKLISVISAHAERVSETHDGDEYYNELVDILGEQRM